MDVFKRYNKNCIDCVVIVLRNQFTENLPQLLQYEVQYYFTSHHQMLLIDFLFNLASTSLVMESSKILLVLLSSQRL